MVAKTGIELLRELAESEGILNCKILQRASGKLCKNLTSCRQCTSYAFAAIADQIEREHEEAMDALEGRLMPEGVEWPRFADGEPMQWGDEFIAPEYGLDEPERLKRLVFIAPELLEEWGQDDGGKFAYEFNFFRAANKDYRPKRPKPAVLAADGLPIEVGQTLYHKADGRPLTVTGFGDAEDGETIVLVEGDYAEVRQYSVTHTPPDTQERIDDDAAMECRDYINACGLTWPEGASLGDIEALKCRDLLRRQRELCERERGGDA